MNKLHPIITIPIITGLLIFSCSFAPFYQKGYTVLDKEPLFNCAENKININFATIDELMLVPGIGESNARAIIKYRNINGYFNSIEQLDNIDGIGMETIKKLKKYLEI